MQSRMREWLNEGPVDRESAFTGNKYLHDESDFV